MPVCVQIGEGRCGNASDSNEARLSANSGWSADRGLGTWEGRKVERVRQVEGWAYEMDTVIPLDRMKGT